MSDCELLLSDTAQPEWRLWQESLGEALLAGHQLRAAVERRFHAPAALLARRIYATGLGDLEALWEAEGRSVAKAIARVAEFAAQADPFDALARAVKR